MLHLQKHALRFQVFLLLTLLRAITEAWNNFGDPIEFKLLDLGKWFRIMWVRRLGNTSNNL